ncbi:MAG TPA: EfeM/EfeO family lipoprotein [Actinocrinis sp.]|nr:EfeM/EfeO family lipoprotein [Actinocrinis sp.]
MRDTPRFPRPGSAVSGVRSSRWQGRLGWLVAVTVVAGAAGPAFAGNVPPGGPVTVSENGCGSPPEQMPAGPVSFTVTNTVSTNAFASVYLIGLADGLVYAEIPTLAPHKKLPLASTLAAGKYALRCVFTDAAVQTSPPITVTGTTTGAVTGYPALPDLDMQGPMQAYRAYVQAALPTLRKDCATLDADVAAGNLAAAKTDWLTAHLDYERLGVAYTSFGDFDDELNGMAQGEPDGVKSTDWTGFFAIEYGLWHNDTPAQLRPQTQGLVTAVDSLIQDFPSEEVDPGDLPLRAHEILENSLQFQLTGIADYGSGTTLATAYANAQGTAEVLSVLSPLIKPRYPALLTAADQELATLQQDLLAQRTQTGGATTWKPLDSLTTAQRQRLDADLGALLEQLSNVPDLLAPRDSA